MSEWQGGFAPGTVPQAGPVSDEAREAIRADLWTLGITDDIFAMDPIKRRELLSRNRLVASAVYAAVKHELSAERQLTETFREWCQRLGLPW